MIHRSVLRVLTGVFVARYDNSMDVSRRSLLLAAPVCLLGAKPAALRVGCQTALWAIDPKDFDGFLRVLAGVKQLGFEGFETSFVNVRPQFQSANAPYDRIRKTGLRFAGVSVALKAYDPHTFIPSLALVQQIADGAKSLGAERVVLSGESAVHPLAMRAKADALEAAAKYCKDAGIACAYHASDYDFQNGATQINALASGTKENVRFVLDAGEGVAEFLAKNSRRVDAIHLLTGQSEGEWEPLKKAIQTAQWRGWLIVDGKDSDAVAPTRAAVRRLFGV
jgi:sugar phosphate isomerase/epimerase